MNSNIVKLSSEQKDAIIEVINIGMEAGSNSLSSILSKKIGMSANKCAVTQIRNMECDGLSPALSISIENTGALEGKFVMVIRQMDIQTILNIFMNGDIIGDSELELDELSLGTIRELVNQVLSSFSNALTEFLGNSLKMRVLEIKLFESNNIFADEFLCVEDSEAMSVNFAFDIDNLINSNFICVISEKLVNMLNEKISMSNKIRNDKSVSGQSRASSGGQSSLSQKMNKRETVGSAYNNSVNIQNGQFPDFSQQSSAGANTLLNGNMDILMDVPLNVTIEIGKTKKKMKEILEFGQGTIIALEKQAGAPVDVVVNGQLIARGDVVVIDDNFGVRITEVIGTATGREEQ